MRREQTGTESATTAVRDGFTFEAGASADAASWDAFVSSRAAGHFMQSYAWGEFQRELGWDTHYCTLREGAEPRAAALLLSRTVPGLGARVFSAPRGPAVDLADRAAAAALFRELAAYVQRERGVLLRCDPYWTQEEAPAGEPPLDGLTRVPRDWSNWNAPRFVLWLDLTGDEEALMMRATPRCRNDIRRGYRNGVDFTFGGMDDVDDFYRLMVLTGNQKGIAFHGVDYYKRLLEVVNRSAKVQLFLGRLEGELITAGMSVAYGRKSWLLYAASAPAHYKTRANRAQQWEMLKWAQAQGCERYDFRGTATNDPPSEQDPGWGVYQFKKSFGPEFVRMTGYYDIVPRPLMYRMFRMAEERLLPIAYRLRTWLQERGAGAPAPAASTDGDGE
jgi:lipid II:glycine glycyltransferase (peptidoglycan interpeptide bridge formation enzyme)